jgi:hypothetical protein
MYQSMKTLRPVLFLARVIACLTLIAFGRSARAADDEIQVDVVVDTTDAGEKIAPATPEHPVYYFPVTKGYVVGGKTLTDQAPPPPKPAVERLIAKALYAQGYRFCNAKNPPTLLLMLWWGYMAPILNEGTGTPDSSMNQGSSQMRGMGGSFGSNQAGAGAVFGAAMHGMLPTNIEENQNQMQELVMGSKFEPDSLQNHPSLRLDTAIESARNARYYLMISAMDLKEARDHKKFVVYWTARVSTDLEGHTLEGVFPTLINVGIPHCGRDTDGPLVMGAPLVPAGTVNWGALVEKTDHPAKTQK